MRVVLVGATFGPITTAHVSLVGELAKRFDRVFLVPCGEMRRDKATVNDTSATDRAAMLRIAISEMALSNVFLDLFDLENGVFTRTGDLDLRYKAKGFEVFHYVGADLVRTGELGTSKIQRTWRNGEELWNELNFVVGKREGYPLLTADLPPHSDVLDVNFPGSSTEVRNRAFARESIDGLVSPGVQYYIERHRLYQANSIPGISQFRLETPRVKVVRSKNPTIKEEMERFCNEVLKPYLVKKNPNLLIVLGGDGTALKTAKKEHGREIPICGINFGNLGFLMNDREGFTQEALLRPFNLYRSPFLEVTAEMMDGSKKICYALNDAYVEKRGTQSIFINVKVELEGKTHIDTTLKGNGLIVATPAGSTAYSLSSGGKPIPLGTNSLALTGICINKPLYWPSGLIPSLDAQFELTNADKSLNCRMRPMNGICDSDLIGVVKSLHIRISPTEAAEFALLPEYNFAGKLMRAQYPEYIQNI